MASISVWAWGWNGSRRRDRELSSSDGSPRIDWPLPRLVLSTKAMRRLLAVLFFLTAFSIALVSGVKADYSIHIGARTPPAEAHCHRVGTRSTDEGRVLNVFVCRP
ncbi:hypothetical protein [Synechococcus sp. MIT S9503]|uniref:hypothetical protein n=1 Tax=Synechococcus sp. MIT S9503 TaxID=3082547 RepID=UPI0039A70EDA